MSRIAEVFAHCQETNRKALVIYACCGCPDMATSEEVIEKEILAGADIIELGVPFSDPMADGAVIQEASQVALANGASFVEVLEMAGRIRERHPKVALVLFSYYNIMLQYGLEQLAAKLKAIGIDAVLAVDLPYEERDELADYGISLIPLISPLTSIERAKMIAAKADGFIYYVTVCGVTGERAELPKELAERLEAIRAISPVPVVAGFGIADGQSAAMVAKHADGVVVGSALVRPLLKQPKAEAIATIDKLSKELSAAMTIA